MRDGEDKGKEKDFMYIMESDGSDALILSLAVSTSHGLLTPTPIFMPHLDKIFF